MLSRHSLKTGEINLIEIFMRTFSMRKSAFYLSKNIFDYFHHLG